MNIYQNYYLYNIILLFLISNSYHQYNMIDDVYVNLSIMMDHNDEIMMIVVVCIIDMVIVVLLNFLYLLI